MTTYKEAGVDIEMGDAFVDRIKPLAKRTITPLVLGGIGGFAGLCSLPKGLEEPILVSGTDGVGTKLKLAFESGKHDTIGIDLVAMCVNDVLTVGATPLFFLDYYGTGKLEVETAVGVVRGISEGCVQAGCALLGGETAELPGFYQKGEYDLAGFAVGVVDKKNIIDGSRVRPGHALVAVASSGLHSNGFSLARKVFFSDQKISFDDKTLGRPLIEVLLEPTIIYAKTVEALLRSVDVCALCHVTGGGVVGNLPRVMPDGTQANLKSWRWPAVFEWMARLGAIGKHEMERTFNLGIGLVVCVPQEEKETCIKCVEGVGLNAWHLGDVTKGVGAASVTIEDV